MTTHQPIAAVHVLSTGAASQHPEHRFGSWKPKLWWALLSRRWIDIPINVFVIDHREGLILFDTGLDPAIASNARYISTPVERFLARRIFRFEIGPDDTLTDKLAALGYAARDVGKAVISHLHFDHVGGIAEIPQADLLVSRREWQRLSEPHPERDFILRDRIEIPGARWRPFDFEPAEDPPLAPFGGSLDIFGDGSITLLPTPGHTPGSVSLLVRRGGLPELLLVGDLAYGSDLLFGGRLPGIGDQSVLRDTYAKVRALKEKLPELVILAAHDPGAAALLAGANRVA